MWEASASSVQMGRQGLAAPDLQGCSSSFIWWVDPSSEPGPQGGGQGALIHERVCDGEGGCSSYVERLGERASDLARVTSENSSRLSLSPSSSVSLVPEAAMPRGHKERLGPRGPCRLKAGLGEGQVGTRQAGRPLPSVLALPAGSP